jgi:hypothetical protein
VRGFAFPARNMEVVVTFEIIPYLGAIPITFAQMPADVQRILGEPTSIDENILGERDESRQLINIRYSPEDAKVAEIAFLPGVPVFLHGCELFGHSDLLGFLTGLDSDVFDSYGFLVFMNLGITVTGFHDDDESQKAITVFRKGRWDDSRTGSTSFRLLK